jgi:hypothetical protein
MPRRGIELSSPFCVSIEAPGLAAFFGYSLISQSQMPCKRRLLRQG